MQDDNEEMANTPQHWTTEDEDDIGMGPHYTGEAA
jgi:hypothetical protein